MRCGDRARHVDGRVAHTSCAGYEIHAGRGECAGYGEKFVKNTRRGLPSQAEHAIVLIELHRWLCSSSYDGAKMEAGENPARSRHCKGGAVVQRVTEARICKMLWEDEEPQGYPSQETCIV